MTKKSLPAALEAKNASDFDQLTQDLQKALSKIESDRRLKPTQGVLCRLAGCSRGTLYNRGWVTSKLQEIKEGRKKADEAIAEAKNAVTRKRGQPELSETEQLEEQLKLSRDEVARLHDQNAILREQLDATKQLLTEIAARSKNTRYDVTPSRPKPTTEKVVPIRESAQAKTGPSKK